MTVERKEQMREHHRSHRIWWLTAESGGVGATSGLLTCPCGWTVVPSIISAKEKTLETMEQYARFFWETRPSPLCPTSSTKADAVPGSFCHPQHSSLHLTNELHFSGMSFNSVKSCLQVSGVTYTSVKTSLYMALNTDRAGCTGDARQTLAN